MKMETNPDQFLDPHLTPVDEAGVATKFYVSFSTGEISRLPVYHTLPRGGLL